MDNALIRRGDPTINSKWSNNQAILSGDVLLLHSYNYLIRVQNKSRNFKLFTQTAIKFVRDNN